MELQIERWGKEKHFTKKVSKLFDESVICYKHNAYRAALLFSYLSFITFIKETIIKSNKPNSINQNRWDNIISELQNDDKWERRTFEEIINSSAPIFNIKEDIRQQVKYWKDRRNDCAHYKDNEIESQHIESFWSFLKSNLSKITIEGGQASLLYKFSNHFDITKTPPNLDFSNLVIEIENSVEIANITNFIKDLSDNLDPFGLYDPDISKVYNKIFELCPTQITDALKDYLVKNNIDVEFISQYPDKINFMRYNKTEVRELWKKRLFQNQNERHMFDIFAVLLRNKLIPSKEEGEAIEHLFNKYDQTTNSFSIKTDVLSVLVNNSILGDLIFDRAIIEDELKTFMWVNSKCDFIAFYLENFTLKQETVNILCEMPIRPNYSYWLESAVVKILDKNPAKKVEFNTLANNNGYIIPNVFK